MPVHVGARWRRGVLLVMWAMSWCGIGCQGSCGLAPKACPWDPGFVSSRAQSEQWAEFTVEDPTVETMRMEITASSGIEVASLDVVEASERSLRFGGALATRLERGTLVRLFVTQTEAAGHRTAKSAWFGYLQDTPVTDCQEDCTPSCAPGACGASDGCGGTCAPCPVKPTCPGAQCLCTPDCPSGSCGGGDGCGGTCGCDAGLCTPQCLPGACGVDDGCGGDCDSCDSGQACAPSCGDRTCGGDGCGGSCGTCPAGSSCTSGQCACTPTCAPGACGISDGCGGLCGPCGSGQSCVNNQCSCAPSCGDRDCGSDGCGGTCGTCAANESCASGQCVCAPSCGNRTCGPDGCGGSCGACGAGTACVNGQCACAPSCGNRTCGSDGCGGSCGSCAANQACVSGQCACAPSCGNRTCGADGCGGSCGACGAGTTCVNGQCACTPSCGSNTCGSDGCGGSCGTCGSGQTCQGGRCVVGCSAPWDPTWATGPGATDYWAEFKVAGGGVLTTSVTVENLATGAVHSLSYGWGLWRGGVVNLQPGARLVLHARNALGATARTLPFRYGQELTPVTDACSGTAATNTTCPPLARGLVTFTFDDSGSSQPSIAIPLMQQYGVRGTFYVVPNFHTWTTLARQLATQGHEFAGHSMSHATLTSLGAQDLEDELRLSKQWIETNIGGTVTSFATPSGAWNATVVDAAKRHYGSHRTTNSDVNYVGSDVFKLATEFVINTSTAQDFCARMQEAATQRGWLILTFHDFTNASSSSVGFTVPATVFEAILACATTTPGLDIVTAREGVAALRCGSPP